MGKIENIKLVFQSKRLSEEFLLRFYILHLDGSDEAGDEITFTAKEGMTEITIDSWIMPSEVPHKFLSLKKKCFEGTTSQNKIVAAEHYWVMLAIEYILYPRERRSDYPFVLPYLEIMNRVMEVKSMIRKIVMWNARHNFGVGVVLKFDAYLKKLVDDKDVKLYFTMIGHIWGWFEEIRSVLRVSREFSGKEQNNLPTNADKLKRKTIETITKIRDKGRKIGGNLDTVSEKIYDNCQSHMDELFVKVVNNEGENLDIVRHNALEELNHRWSRMHIRRRTGRNKTTKEMIKYGALLAVLSNLDNEDYDKAVFGDVEDFVRDLQNITDEELQEARQLIRKFPQCPLIKSDVKRPEMLRGFVALGVGSSDLRNI